MKADFRCSADWTVVTIQSTRWFGWFSGLGSLPCISGLHGGLRCYSGPIAQWLAFIDAFIIYQRKM